MSTLIYDDHNHTLTLLSSSGERVEQWTAYNNADSKSEGPFPAELFDEMRNKLSRARDRPASTRATSPRWWASHAYARANRPGSDFQRSIRRSAHANAARAVGSSGSSASA